MAFLAPTPTRAQRWDRDFLAPSCGPQTLGLRGHASPAARPTPSLPFPSLTLTRERRWEPLARSCAPQTEALTGPSRHRRTSRLTTTSTASLAPTPRPARQWEARGM